MTFCLRTLRSPAMRYLPGFQFGDGIKGSERSDAMRCRRTLSGHEKRMIPEIFSRVRFDECLEPLLPSGERCSVSRIRDHPVDVIS